MANMKKLTRDYGEIIWTGKKCIMGMPISFTRYILTDSKLITRVGLLNLKEDEIELYRVYDKSMKLPFGQRIVGCGTITLLSKDSDTPTKVMQSVKHPRDVKRLLDSAIQEQRDKYSVRGRDMMGASAHMDDRDGYGIPDHLSSPAALWSERRFSSIFPNKCSLFHKCCMIGWQIHKATLHKDHLLDFVRVLLASFPSYCTIRPCKATALPRPRCTI